MPRVNTGGVASDAVLHYQRHLVSEALMADQFDVNSDPYVHTNHLGQLECKLCATHHRTVASYLTHVQGHRHKDAVRRYEYNAAKRAGRMEEAARYLAEGRNKGRRLQTAGLPPVSVTPVRTSDGHLGAVIHAAFPAWRRQFSPPQCMVLTGDGNMRLVM